MSKIKKGVSKNGHAGDKSNFYFTRSPQNTCYNFHALWTMSMEESKLSYLLNFVNHNLQCFLNLFIEASPWLYVP
jgi:hypothetical protein